LKKSASNLWPSAKEIVLPYDGQPSQIFVVDLPLTEIGNIIKSFSSGFKPMKIRTLDSCTYDPNGTPVWSEQICEKIVSASNKATHHVLATGLSGDRFIDLWIWTDPTNNTFTIEIVFWADNFFPDPTNEPACIESFSDLLNLAEGFRAFAPNVDCILAYDPTYSPDANENSGPSLIW